MVKTVVCDIEADALLHGVTVIHCIVCKDWDSGEVTTFIPSTLDQFPAFADTVDYWVGHNFVAYDARVIKKLMGYRINPRKIIDTLLISRTQKYNRDGGHSLANWGKFFNSPKGNFTDFSRYTDEMLTYCIQDVELTYKVAVYLKSEGGRLGSDKANVIEALSTHLLEDQNEYGFALDVEKAYKLFAYFGNEANTLRHEILNEILPVSKLVRHVIPKYTKDGSLSRVGLSYFNDYTVVSGEFSKIEFIEFNLDSPKQKVTRLNPWWSPTVRTEGYRKMMEQLREKEISKEEAAIREPMLWKLCEENFMTISDDAPQSLKKLGKYAMYSARHKEVEGWLDALGKDNRVHGQVQSVGAITHRMSHRDPNTANIPGSQSPYGTECRSCFTVREPDSYCLLGVDASGIQLRILAHYMNDPDYTEEVVNGDVHTKNMVAAGIKDRDTAKTFIYAFLLGAGNEKIGSITGGTPAQGKALKEQFLDNTPALADLKVKAGKQAKKGFMVGIDGRKIPVKSAHFVLSCYLQGAESVIMKYAMILYHNRIKKLNLDAHQVAVVHDEFQIEVLKEHAEQVGEIVVQSIRDSGEYFNLNCPMDGEYKVGLNWADTH